MSAQPFAGKWRQRCARIRAAANVWRAANMYPQPIERRPISTRRQRRPVNQYGHLSRNQQKGRISETTGPAASPHG